MDWKIKIDMRLMLTDGREQVYSSRSRSELHEEEEGCAKSSGERAECREQWRTHFWAPDHKSQQVVRCEQCAEMDGYVRQREKSRRVAGVIRPAGWL
ncbi:hypothetical protein SRHO_G00122010 [Serrasalmus rhombeus]